jgi:DNA (cytosine-5)-methyltransferase 1
MTARNARPATPPSGQPVLLDAYCGAGGAARGYQLAGFHVVGVDLAPQPRYAGDEFHQGDAIEFIRRHGREFDAIHSSPPCQLHSVMSACRPEARRRHPELIAATRAALLATGRPYAIENVPGAPLIEPIMLCGTFFGLRVYRHRLFETSVFVLAPKHAPHRDRCPGTRHKAGSEISPKGFVTVTGHGANTEYKKWAMGIDWMRRDEMAQAIPPAYTNWLGRQLLRALGRAA